MVEKIGEKKNEILVRENESLGAKIAKESLLAENVYDYVDRDEKAKCEFVFLPSFDIVVLLKCGATNENDMREHAFSNVQLTQYISNHHKNHIYY